MWGIWEIIDSYLNAHGPRDKSSDDLVKEEAYARQFSFVLRNTLYHVTIFDADYDVNNNGHPPPSLIFPTSVLLCPQSLTLALSPHTS